MVPLKDFLGAAVTSSGMNAYCSTTIRASVHLFLLRDELVNPMLPDEFQVLNHTHVVLDSVAIVKLDQVFTWESFALKTEINLVFGE